MTGHGPLGPELSRLPRVDVDADDAVLTRRPLLRCSTEALESLANSHLLEASGGQDVDKLCARQSASDSTRPEIDIFA